MSEIQYWIKTSEYLALEEPLMIIDGFNVGPINRPKTF